MLSKKGYAAIFLLLAAAVLLTGRVRLKLDALVEPLRNSVEEVMYLPRGEAMRIIACGFDTPLADALYIKGLVYFSTNVLHRQNLVDQDGRLVGPDKLAQGRDYTYELFDIVTDLNPRFIRAYQMGAFSLSASRSLKSNLHSITLLEKGVAEFDAIERDGGRVPVDPRWLFHLMQATTYEVSLTGRLRQAGDKAGAAAAKEKAEEEFLRAAKSPDVPYFVTLAAVGYQDGVRGGDLLATRQAMLSVWEELYEEAIRREDEAMQDELELRIAEDRTFIENVQATRKLEQTLSPAGQEFLRRYGRPPVMPGDLVGSGLVRGLPRELPLDLEDNLDRLVALPDGTFRSRRLGMMESQQYVDYLMRAVIAYQRSHNGDHPPSLQSLVQEEFVTELPSLPFVLLGQTLDYDPDLGALDAHLPPELRSTRSFADAENGVSPE